MGAEGTPLDNSRTTVLLRARSNRKSSTMTASELGMPGVGSKIRRIRCGVSSTSMWASSSVPAPNFRCIRPFSRGVTVASGAAQRVSRRPSVKARHTRSTATSMSTRWAKLRYWPLTRPTSLLLEGHPRHGNQRHEDDADGDEAEVGLDHRDVAEEIAGPDEQQHPAEAADQVVQLETQVGHAPDSGDERGAGTDDGR